MKPRKPQISESVNRSINRHSVLLNQVKRNYEIYIMLIPILAYFIIFCYIPMSGLQIAFRNYKTSKGIWGSDWVGMKYFIRFFNSPVFGTIVGNTFKLSTYSLAAGFFFSFILALLLNYQKNLKLKKIVQFLSFAPHFISMVVFVGMIRLFTAQYNGVFNHIREYFGFERINYLASAKIFPHLYVWSGIWQNMGWSAIIYIGALSAVSPELHEAAIADGATLLQRVWHIDLPCIMDTILIILIINCGNILNIGFEKIYLMLNDLNASTAEVISTYVYKQGLVGGQLSYSTAIGMFNSAVNLFLLIIVNQLSRRVRNVSVF